MDRGQFRIVDSSPQEGFSLISAIFLLVILSSLGAFMVTISGVQHASAGLAAESSRAYLAAHAGMEWAAYKALQEGSCGNTNFSVSEGALNGFAISVSCTQSVHRLGSTDVPLYQITVTAERGSWGGRDFVARRLSSKLMGAAP